MSRKPLAPPPDWIAPYAPDGHSEALKVRLRAAVEVRFQAWRESEESEIPWNYDQEFRNAEERFGLR